ncbi:MAG: hypothetical protein ACREJ2_00930, partial [Planctomycetota bacterium]
NPSVQVNATQSFSASGKDQFATVLAVQPVFTWTVSGGGTISGAGQFTAGASAGGPFTVTATSGAKTGTVQVTVTALPQYATPKVGGCELTAADGDSLPGTLALFIFGLPLLILTQILARREKWRDEMNASSR